MKISVKKVMDLCDIKTGKYDANHAVENGDYYFYTCALAPLKADTFSFEGELIMLPGNGANLGEVMYHSGQIEAYQRTYVLHNINCHPKYLYYFLKVNWKSYILTRQIGSATNYMKLENISELKVPIVDYDMQEKIVNVLDKVQSLIEKRKESIAKLDELVQAVFLDMFGDLFVNPKNWCVKEFGYFAKIDNKMTKDFNFYRNYPHIGIDNIEKNTGRLIRYKSVEEENLASNKYLFTEEHIIYSKIRPYLNKVAIPDFKGLCSADAYPILVNTEHTNRYFFAYILKSKYFLEYVEKLSNRTSIPKVNKKQLEGFSCIAPPIQLQDEFATIILNIEAYKEKLNRSLCRMEDNLNSILQQAFKGELNINTETTA
ncbi:restriction endonuclease subunit S [Bacillus cereus group sp. LD113LC]|uniref:restriction endonuclease subunit S n=1 Tax=unclassified Bacillus cereus group TaxID=2750818 RepID=UPI0022E4094D|nr:MULTISPECIES: restriction endonuclease subunit S [unclassified Bacillus cereus group]MDA1542432.1 restriction endonuclease subunit S [Bacillus cereus group sp. TH244-1LC]MDA1621253.1 restriction endonuclease subunit S [Bacillus cereus group sp. TH206-1LC]MDA1751907.1 restriction endonuclease subunit S [Bacillus cereus group sp. LD113LC]